MAEPHEDGHLGRLQALSDQSQRQELLQRILEAGWDVGCWLRPEEAHLVYGGSPEQREILRALDHKDFAGAEPGEDPNLDGLPQSPIDGTDPCWVVVSQQCDLVRDFRHEPFVELARVNLIGLAGPPPDGGPTKAERKATKQWEGQLKQLADRIRNWWLASARFSPVSPEISESGQWVVDLRERILLPKDLLVAYPAAQALPENTQPYFCRDRFKRRLGDRYARAALPERYRPIATWLREVSKDGPGNTMVREWVLRPPTASALAELHAIGLTQDELDDHGFDGERWVTELGDAMPEHVRGLLDPEIRWAPADDFPVATWDGAWRLDDLEGLSWLDPVENPLPPR